MKTARLFLTFILLYFIAAGAHAQIGKGINVLSGNIFYSTSSSSGSSTDSKTSSLIGMPRYGHLFGEKTEAGISIGYDWSNHETNNTSTNDRSEGSSGLFLAGPYLRIYQNLAERFYFTFTGAATFYTGKDKETNTTASTTNEMQSDVFRFQVGISPGLTYFFNNHWATSFSLGVLNYDSTKTTDKSNDESSTANTFSAGINSGGLIFGIGFYF